MVTAAEKRKALNLAESLFKAAFNTPRDLRSTEYKAGVRAVLDFRIDGGRMPRPYPVGTAQADAFYAGVDEGHRIWREYEAQERSTREVANDGC
jgi:hypothetical protein